MMSLRNQIADKLRSYVPRTVVATDRIPAAVLVPFFDKEGEPYVLFTKRTSDLQYHKGEISFPGGTREPQDADLQQTALRELFEEVAIPAEKVQILGALDQLRTVSSMFLVLPYVAYLETGATYHPNEREVEEILEVPFRHFENPEIFRQQVRLVEDRPRTVYYYQWRNHTIWGLTARILKTLIDLLKGEKHD
jgi:8-oxo-dGTP pyrophosphatase MutT (NUDIX family)